ncbi:RIC8B [Cordylochernes scorpioides]|uniref:RIC8B n=1 Tax=Cordylochernes scorpioides TaxID=51811 RepID=A0ABY6L9S5_9ARAC|nr:RIC8B [Cordylochernes scorpioides]
MFHNIYLYLVLLYLVYLLSCVVIPWTDLLSRPKLRIQWHGLTYLMEVLDLILKSNMEHHRAKGKKRFSRNSRHGKDRGGGSPHIMVPCLLDAEVELACEVLKVLFNLTVNLDHRTLDEPEEAHFLRLASILHDTLLCNTRSPDKKLLLHSYTVDLLTVMPDSAYEELLTPLTDLPIGSDDAEFDFEGMNMEAVIVLVEFLEFRLSTKILPPLKDVMNKPEDGNTLRNRFCVCAVSRLIKYTGYGNAAGLLANRGMMLGGSTGRYSSESEDTDTEEYRQYKEDINPVVGCYQPPGPNPMEGLTEEQKEYEAMQLVNVLDKMTM